MIIVDQVSVCIPLLRLARSCGIIFYCHYPDYLLTNNKSSLLKSLYRAPLDFLEEQTTGAAHLIFVNSLFTAGVFAEAFPTLNKSKVVPQVLYPPLNLEEQDKNAASAEELTDVIRADEQLLLSINRFERKKNIGLAIRTFAALPKELQQKARLVLAGGYDERLPENVDHAVELQKLAEELGVKERVHQMWSISSTMKAGLLKKASCLLYTPDREHFGIVPVEAMYARVPVLAVNTGGPTESIVDGETGYLRPPEPDAWATAAAALLSDVKLRQQFGEAGRNRVDNCFSLKAFGMRLDLAVRVLAAGASMEEISQMSGNKAEEQAEANLQSYAEAKQAFGSDNHDLDAQQTMPTRLKTRSEKTEE